MSHRANDSFSSKSFSVTSSIDSNNLKPEKRIEILQNSKSLNYVWDEKSIPIEVLNNENKILKNFILNEEKKITRLIRKKSGNKNNVLKNYNKSEENKDKKLTLTPILRLEKTDKINIEDLLENKDQPFLRRNEYFDLSNDNDILGK